MKGTGETVTRVDSSVSLMYQSGHAPKWVLARDGTAHKKQTQEREQTWFSKHQRMKRQKTKQICAVTYFTVFVFFQETSQP